MGDLIGVFGINWKLLLIQAFNFGLLLTVLTYFLYKPVLRIIDERRAKIAEGVRTAEAADQKLALAKLEGDNMVGKAARDAEGLVATARTRADEKGSEIVKSAESRARALLADASARAEEAERQAMLESQKDIARAAMLAAEKILRSER
ncbi:MAG TPA: F0F1 ATP synthase subunit B [Candidatus Paceibacterota bacterium]